MEYEITNICYGTNYISGWPLQQPIWMRIQLPRNWLTSKASEHSPCNGQASAFQNAKGKLSNDQNPFSFLITYFYNPPKVLEVWIPSHRIPPTHPWCSVTPMTLVLFLIPQSSSKFECLPQMSKCDLLVDMFSPEISYFNIYGIWSEIRSDMS